MLVEKDAEAQVIIGNMLTLYSRKVRMNMDNEQKVADITESQNAPVQTEKKKMRML